MKFNRNILLRAFNSIGIAALAKGDRLELLIYGGSALLIASNFRFSTEDVDAHDVTQNQPDWLQEEISAIATKNNWSADWLNDAVNFHLSPLASKKIDHVEFGSFPRGPGPYGLDVLVPTAEYMLALKLKAMRILDPVKGQQEAKDILNLMQVSDIKTPEAAITTLKKYFPKSASSPEKQLFLLKHLKKMSEPNNAPTYPITGSSRKSSREFRP